VGSGRLAVGLGAVIFTGLAAGLLGLAGGSALGERSGLALAGAGRLVELAAEALVLGLQVVGASLKGLGGGTRGGLHTSIIGEARAAAAPPRLRNRDQLELDPLNKYVQPRAVSAVKAAKKTRSICMCSSSARTRTERPNNKVQQRGRLGRLRASEYRHAGPVCCNALFGLETLNGPD